jgi:peroxiredoxin
MYDARPPVSPFNIGRLQPGAPVPRLVLKTEDGVPFDLNDALRRKPTILVFYQSRYCGQCVWQFGEVLLAKAEVETLGFQLFAMSKVPAGETGRGLRF